MAYKGNSGPAMLPLPPSGGSALQGLGETFSPDPITGTGNLSVPLVVPPECNGLWPKLALTYGTGHGNGPFVPRSKVGGATINGSTGAHEPTR